MITIKKHLSPTSGFALIVVLSTLAILTLLFAISTRLSLAHIQAQETELHIAERAALNKRLLHGVSGHLAEAREGGTYEITVDGQSYQLRVIDVGGLVDLNTASPPLLDAYLSALGMTQEEIARLRAWRQTSKRLLRVEDLIRVTGTTALDQSLLLQTATVHSGRPGVSLEDAPEALRDLIFARWDEAWTSPRSGMNFSVGAGGSGGKVSIGVAHVPPGGAVKILRSY
jgi:hypothetical protein